MQLKTFGKTLIVRLDPGDEIISSLQKIIEKQEIPLATVSGIGAVNDVTIGLFDPETKVYTKNDLQINLEIVSLAGNISTMDGKPYLHLHLAVADKEARVYGGHLNKAVVSATAEIIITPIDGVINRVFSEKIGLNIIDF